VLLRGSQKMFPRKEEHDNLGCLRKLVPIRFCAELIHPRANLCGVPAKMLETLPIIRCFMSFQIGGQDGFGIDDDLPPARQPNDHIRPQSSVVGRYSFLFKEITVGDHAGKFRDSLQRDLSPAASNIRRTERFDQIARFLL
jgi:hypothetical protein